MTQANPLLDFTGLPRFDLVEAEHVKPAIESLLLSGKALIEQLTSDSTPATWNDFAGALSAGLEPFGRAWGIVGHLHSVNDIPVWRDAYNEMLPEVSRFYTELGQNLKLFEKYKALRTSPEYQTLNTEQKKVIDNEVRDFRLSGADLPENQKPRFQEIMEELSQLSTKFSENVLDATNAFSEVVIDKTELCGLPDDALEAALSSAESAGVEGWRFTLHAPSYGPVMQYADNRSLRARMYRAYATRAAEFTDGSNKTEWDNTPIMHRLLELKQEEASMLGFTSFAELSLATKMADTPAQVLGFLRDLAAKAKSFAAKDITELKNFASEALGLDDFQPWDAAYVSEKLRQQRYAFSEQDVKQYFTEPKVLAGLFNVIERLFSVYVKPDSAPVWHPDVKFFRIESPEGELIGQFYLDLYARETKRGGAWMDEARARCRTQEGIQKPIAYLNCNFARPVGHKPATLTHDEVTTLFHETGHGLHHLLTRGEELGVSGIHGVEWDAVELPSQFMENYCWEWDVLQEMTEHIDTGEKLPRSLFDKMIQAKNFQSGMMTVRQIEFSLFDMLLHSDYDPKGSSTIIELINQVRQEVAVLIPPEWHRFPNSFSHIFAGGYAAGYFSYKWAEVLSADAYSAFEESGNPFDLNVGKRYLDEILSVGGSRPAIDSFKAFRGREPRVDALLRHSGMITS